MWPQEKFHLSNFDPLKFFRILVFGAFLVVPENFSILHFRKRAPECAHGTLDDIQGQHLGQNQSFYVQIFQNVAPTLAYVVLL